MKTLNNTSLMELAESRNNITSNSGENASSGGSDTSETFDAIIKVDGQTNKVTEQTEFSEITAAYSSGATILVSLYTTVMGVTNPTVLRVPLIGEPSPYELSFGACVNVSPTSFSVDGGSWSSDNSASFTKHSVNSSGLTSRTYTIDSDGTVTTVSGSS